MLRGGAQLRDLLLPAAVVAVVGMMIFPLPSALLDILLMMNISLSVVLLLSSVYLSEPEKFTALPTILLLSTLFRLGLNISTTRQLLGEGSAPEVVIAFGNFVVSGNVIVGAVIFCIVTLVQFLVIAKGSERVAEVAARFTLDAMPGKQMSIDADIRAGILSLQEAREKRRELQRESKLYGALDGAMKFVKGDALAGLLITAINISAGFLVGVMQQRLSIVQALQKYTIFTIGDGLVSQIPALLTAVAAGIAVTRVGDKEGSFVGRELISQLTKEPQALFAAGTVLGCLAITPGLPLLPFGAMSLFFVLSAASLKSRSEKRKQEELALEFRPKVAVGIALRLSSAAAVLLQKERTLPALVQELRQREFEIFGIVIADVQFDVDVGKSGVAAEICYRGVKIKEVRHGVSPEESFSSRIAAALAEMVQNRRSELLDDTQTRVLLELHQVSCEDLINSVVPKLLSVTELTAVLRELVSEEVSIKSMNTILQAIAEFAMRHDCSGDAAAAARIRAQTRSRTKGDDWQLSRETKIASAVRIALRRSISRSVADENWNVEAFVLSAELDQLLSRVAYSGMAVHPSLAEQLEEEVKALRAARPGKPFVLLGTAAARAVLAQIVRGERDIRILAAEELSEEVRLRVAGEIAAPRSSAETDEGNEHAADEMHEILQQRA